LKHDDICKALKEQGILLEKSVNLAGKFSFLLDGKNVELIYKEDIWTSLKESN